MKETETPRSLEIGTQFDIVLRQNGDVEVLVHTGGTHLLHAVVKDSSKFSGVAAFAEFSHHITVVFDKLK